MHKERIVHEVGIRVGDAQFMDFKVSTTIFLVKAVTDSSTISPWTCRGFTLDLHDMSYMDSLNTKSWGLVTWTVLIRKAGGWFAVLPYTSPQIVLTRIQVQGV